MDQALDWLILMEYPSAEQQAAFEAWYAADPRHAQAYARASDAWNAQPVFAAAQVLQQQRRPSLSRRLRPHWKPLASAAALLIALGIHGNLPLRLQADHLTVAGERQHLQLEDGSKVLLNTNSAFSSRFNERQHQARLYKGGILRSRRRTRATAGNRCRTGPRQRQRYQLRGALPRR
ncbi:Iron siderophore sensor protein [Pseudomonas sp. FEN]|nr:Iron siderophore sensor protein [Pseudomonas sp. FEN]